MRRNAPGRLAALACAGLAAIAVCGALSVGGPPQRPAPAPATPPASVPATSPATFKVATFNVLYENRDLKAVAETIRKSGADVVCLQETNEAAEKSLREQLGKTYPHATFKPGAGASGFGILSRTPLRNVKHLPPKEGWFGTHLCEANLAGRAVQIIDAHLTASTPPAGASVAEAAQLANIAAGIAVGRVGTAAVSQKELLDALDGDWPLIAADRNRQAAAAGAGSAPGR